MTPKKTFLTTVVFAVLVAMGLAAGFMPGAGLLSVKQMFSAAEAYIVDLNSLELDTDNNPITPVNEPISMLGGDEILVNAVAVYSNGARGDLLIGPDLQYSVDPPELGTIEANTGELRARFIASTDIQPGEGDDVVEGTIVATARGYDSEEEAEVSVVGTLDIEITPLKLTSISVVTPQDGGLLFVKEDVDTDVPIVATTNAPQITNAVDFLADGEDLSTDTTSPYTALYTANSSQDGDTIEFEAQTAGTNGLLSDTAEVEVATFPADTDNNGVPDDYFGDVDEGDVTYAVAGTADVVVAGLPTDPDGPMTVATADGIIVEIPEDIYENIPGVDSGDIDSVRLIVRTGPTAADVLGVTPDGLPDGDQVGDALDIHLLMVVNGETVEVHNFTEPITVMIPLDGDVDVSQLFGISTELDSNADPVVDGDAFAQMGVSAEITGGMLVFNVTEFTSYVPLSVDGAPVVTDIAPSQGSEAGGTIVTITGDDFAPNAEVTIGGTPATVTEYNLDPSGPDSIVATTGRHDITSDENVDVVVTNPDDALFGAIADGFMYLPTAPEIDNITPVVGNTGTIVTITGDFFDTNAQVFFGDYTTVIQDRTTPTELVVVVPEDVDEEEDVAVRVLNPSTGRSDSADFSYVNTPVLNTVDPTEGSEAGGLKVTLTGSNLPNIAAAQVTFGNVVAAIYYYNPQHTIYGVTTPMVTIGAPTDVDVVVTNTTTLGASNPGVFTFLPEPPVFNSKDVDSGPDAGGTTVTITGAWFDDDVEVTFDGLAGTIDDSDSGTIDVITPAHTVGVVDVVITNPSSGLSVGAGTFEYLPSCPSITDITPATGSTAGGDSVAITFSAGGIFDADASVTFGGIAANTPELTADNVLTVVTPAHDAGDVDVVVSEGDCTATGSFTYEYEGPALPVIGSVDPDSGPTTGGDIVWIMGENFTDDAAVTFGGVPATNVIVPTEEPDAGIYPPPSASAVYGGPGTLILCTAPAGTEGAVDVTVSQASGNATLADGYTYVIPDLELTAQDLAASAGDQGVQIEITLHNISTQMIGDAEFGLGTAFSFTVLYDPAILVPVDDNDPFATGHQIHTDGDAATAAGKNVASNVVADGRVTVVISGGQMPVNDGTLCFLNFNVAADAPVGHSVADITQISAADASAAPLVAGGIDGDVLVVGPPEITGVKSVDGVEGATEVPETGGVEVVLTGNFFAEAANLEVTIGGETATVVSVLNANDIGSELTVVAPAIQITTATDVDVTITDTTTTNSVTLNDALTYTPVPPTITTVVPSQGIFETAVTITGENFDVDSTVTFDGTAADNVVVVNSTTITCTAPDLSGGDVDVTVNNPSTGDSDTASDAFTYLPPAITSLTPDSGDVAGGTNVTITGTWFASNATVTVDGVDVGATWVDQNTITFVTPAGVEGDVDVIVTQTSGTSLATFTYTAKHGGGGGGNAGGWGPCFVATAAYGSPMADEVATLRQFRDQYLLSNALGTKLVEMYYTYSPRMADAISQSATLRAVVRAALTPAVALSKLMLGTSTASKVGVLGLIALAAALIRRKVSVKGLSR